MPLKEGHHRPIEKVVRWRADNGPPLNNGVVAV